MPSEREAFAAALADLFGSAADDAFADAVLSAGEADAEDFAAGEVIYEDGHTKAALGILVAGGAEIVRKTGADGEVLLKDVSAGDVFGAALLFADSGGYSTVVRAKQRARVIFLPQALLERILAENPQAALGYIAFLTGKIRFLNARLAVLTADSAQGKLAGYLLRASDGRDSFVPDLSYLRLAELLGLGRASLYRAFDALVAAGAIEKEQKRILIKNRAYLARIMGESQS